MPIRNFSGFLPSITVFGLVVPVYYVVISLAFSLSLLWLVRRTDERALSRNRALDISLVVMVSGFLGSRLFHIFYEEPAYYWARPALVFDIWSGGFVWYGGAIVAVVMTVLFLRWKQEPLGIWFDLFAPICAFGYAVGRMACVLTGCCYGRVVHLPAFLGSVVGMDLLRHPSQLYAVIGELISLTILLKLENFKHGKIRQQPGQLFLVWLVLHSVGRIFMEQFRDDPRGAMPLGFSIATWLSLAILIGSATALVKGRFLSPLA